MHRIRLAGPWQITSEPPENDDPWTSTVLPCTFEATSDLESPRARRKFHSPTSIDDSTVLRIAIVGVGIARALLNGVELPATVLPPDSKSDPDALAFDATGRLKSFNELEIELSSSKDQPAKLQSAELQIG